MLKAPELAEDVEVDAEEEAAMRELLSGTEVEEVEGGPGSSGRKCWAKACKEGGGS